MLRVLHLYLKVAIFQPELRPQTRKAATGQAGIEPATVRLRQQPRKPRDNLQRPVCKQQIRTAPQRERIDTHDPRRGFVGHLANSHGAAASALRPRLRRGSRAQIKSRLKEQKMTSTTRISAEGRTRAAEIVKCPQFLLASTTPISAEGRAHRLKIV